MNRWLAIPLLAVLAAAPARGQQAPPDSTQAPPKSTQAPPDTMVFTPVDAWWDSAGAEPHRETSFEIHNDDEGVWLRAPVGDAMLTPPEQWRDQHDKRGMEWDASLDYNRVDLVRYGVRFQAQRPETMYPRLGLRLEYSTGRIQELYGVQIEQPLLPTARFALGVSMTRRTDHYDLQQVEDLENSLVMLFAREDWRDYFEREGMGAYLSWRVPDFSTVSAHVRTDEYRSLIKSRHPWSIFNVDNPLRDNPAVDEGESNRALVRLERLTHQTSRSRGGLYHWIEYQYAGGQLGGDFEYSRALADVRSVVRLMPAVTLSLRAVGGATLSGVLPRQEQFAVGGVDGLRAHRIGDFLGDQMALVQADYTIGLWQLRSHGVEGGLQALVFADAGTAWNHPENGWDVTSQKFAVDGGFGITTSEDEMRLTFARNLQDPGSDFVVGFRLNRPF